MEKAVKVLYEAALEGSVSSLIHLLQEDPLILERCLITSFKETPLHIAAMLGHVEFCLELLSQKPDLAGELDSRKSSALHLASAKGYVEIVKALVSVKPEMCFACDCDGNNPLHVAAIKGRISVLRELIKVQPDAVRARVDRGETILHLCVHHYQLDALKFLVEELNDQEFVNAKDDKGNTILHLAVADKQSEIIRYLLSITIIDVNAQNSNGMTTLDILAQSRRHTKDMDIADCLQIAAINKSNEITSSLSKLGNHKFKSLSSSISEYKNMNNSKIQRVDSSLSSLDRGSWENYFKKQDAWLDKQRDALMVVASLIATMAFQAGVTPPSGLWQDNIKLNLQGQLVGDPHKAGNSILADQSPTLYKRFIAFNTASFISSLSIILLLISGLPFKRKVFMWILMLIMWMSVSSTALTYLISVSASIPPKEHEHGALTFVVSVAILGWIGLMTLLVLLHTIRLMLVIFRNVKKLSRGSRRWSSKNLNFMNFNCSFIS